MWWTAHSLPRDIRVVWTVLQLGQTAAHTETGGKWKGSWRRRLPRGALRSGVRMRPEEMGVPGRGKEHFILRQLVECGRAEAWKGCTGSYWESVNYKHPSLGEGRGGRQAEGLAQALWSRWRMWSQEVIWLLISGKEREEEIIWPCMHRGKSAKGKVQIKRVGY